MRRWLTALFLVATLGWPGIAPAQDAQPVPALGDRVIDQTGVLSGEQRQALVQRLADFERAKGTQTAILLVPTTAPEDIADYAQRVFEHWQLGREREDDGLLIIVATDDRRARIHTGYGLEGAIPDLVARRVIDERLAPRFQAGDFGDGLLDATAALFRLIDGEALPPPSRIPSKDVWKIALLGGAGLAIGLYFLAIALPFTQWGWAVPWWLRVPLLGTASGGVAWLVSERSTQWLQQPWFVLAALAFGALLGLCPPARLQPGVSGDSGNGGSGGGGSSSGGGGGSSGGGGASGSY